MSPWKGKWALVTGASAGIGREIARQLAATGANVILTARREDRLLELGAELKERHHVQIETHAADLSRPEAAEELFHFTQEKGLAVEVLINNAGFGMYGEFQAMDRHRLFEMVQVNVASVVQLTHLFLPGMIGRGFGYVMIVSSTAAFQGVPYLSAYGATKGFDLLFGEALSEEMLKYGVRVTVLCPGSTVTEFHEVAGRLSTGRQEPAEKVARGGLEGMVAGESLVISGVRNRLAMEAQRLAPRKTVTKVTGWMFRPTE